MRERLEKAETGQTLTDVLVRIGPAELRPFIKNGPGFRIEIAAPNVRMEPVTGAPNRYRFTGTSIVADATVEYSEELGVVSQSIALTNEGTDPSPPINALEAFYLPLSVRLKDRPRACGFGGGMTDGFYPPRAFRPEMVCFGKARDWNPTSKVFSRWWTTKRSYTLSSGPTGRSTNPNLELMQYGWEAGDGQVWLWASLEWSGKWQIQVGNEAEWTFIFRGGPTVKRMVLERGETIHLPRVHVGICGGAGATQADGLNQIRRYTSKVIAPDVEGRRPWAYVAYHHWFGIDTTLNDALLRKQADRAAELGIEYFEVDAAWYASDGKRFFEGIGNWGRVDTEKFPQGLESFAEYVRSKGLRFGLWFEPERARVGSDWQNEHPDWYWPTGSPQYYFLDLTKREAQDGLIEMLSDWIGRLDIRWLRWDNNHSAVQVLDQVDPTGKVQFAYFEGLYRVFDTLLERHRNLMIDNCAGGGQRSDFGTLRRAGTMVPSDHAEDPHICRIMQTGGARVLPANYMNTSFFVGAGEGDSPIGPLELISRMAGAMSFSGHIADFSAKHTRMIRKYLDGYRKFRHLLMEDFYPLTPYPQTEGDWDVVEFIDPRTAEAVILAYRVRGDTSVSKVTPRALDPQKTYQVSDPFSSRKPRGATGNELMSKGLRISLKCESGAVRRLVPVGP